MSKIFLLDDCILVNEEEYLTTDQMIFNCQKMKFEENNKKLFHITASLVFLVLFIIIFKKIFVLIKQDNNENESEHNYITYNEMPQETDDTDEKNTCSILNV